MISCRFTFTLILLALTYFAPRISADTSPSRPAPSNLRGDILYTHRGEFVQVKPMRPLTLTAHVEQFAYDPLGIEIAVSGSDVQGDQTIHFVKTIDSRTGHEISRMTLTSQTGESGYDLMLLGWSPSGKYLLVQQFSPDPKEFETELVKFLRLDLSATPPVTRIVDPLAAFPLEEQSPDSEGSADGHLSPDGRWVSFSQLIQTQKPNGRLVKELECVLYDLEHDTLKVLALPPKIAFSGEWGDKTHVKFRQGGEDKWFDVVTDQITPAPASPLTLIPLTSRAYPDLSLDTQSPVQQDAQSKEGRLGSYIIWIRRTSFGKLPLGVAAAGLMPRPQIPEYPGRDNPNAAWSPTGKQIAFVANNDLYVTDLMTATEILPREKSAVGLKLSCPEEQALAVQNLSQIGLGIIQYAQDYDETLPRADGFMRTLSPYLESADVFQVDGHPFVYEQPADLALASIEAPADTEQGYMDLPCARVVLFCDGHVKVFKK